MGTQDLVAGAVLNEKGGHGSEIKADSAKGKEQAAKARTDRKPTGRKALLNGVGGGRKSGGKAARRKGSTAGEYNWKVGNSRQDGSQTGLERRENSARERGKVGRHGTDCVGALQCKLGKSQWRVSSRTLGERESKVGLNATLVLAG